MKIIADAHIPFLRGVAENYGETVYLNGNEFTRERIHDADALIVRTVTHFDQDILENSNIKIICSATIGFDHIDTKYCNENGIKWTNAPGCNSGSVQQYVASVLIELSRRKNFMLEGKTLGIVGVGNVGKKVAEIAHLLGMNVILNDPPRQKAEKSDRFVDLETVKREADIITFHTPLTKSGEYKTYHLADEDFFDSLGKRPIIINSARGSIIEMESIKSAIKGGKISGAVIDCWENEPKIDLNYLNMVDMATPHIAGYSADGKANATRMALISLAEFFGMDTTPLSQIKASNPENAIIDFSCLKGENKLYDALLHTYSPENDFANLLRNPDKFTYFREHYPLRRESSAYTVINYPQEAKKFLEKAGFKFEQ